MHIIPAVSNTNNTMKISNKRQFVRFRHLVRWRFFAKWLDSSRALVCKRVSPS